MPVWAILSSDAGQCLIQEFPGFRVVRNTEFMSYWNEENNHGHSLVSEGGVEPPRANAQQGLSLSRLPIPPLRLTGKRHVLFLPLAFVVLLVLLGLSRPVSQGPSSVLQTCPHLNVSHRCTLGLRVCT